MSTRQNNRVFCYGVTNHTLCLCVLIQVGRRVIYSKHIIQVEDCSVVQQLLLQHFKLIEIIIRSFKSAIGEANLFLYFSFITRRKVGLNCNHYGIVVVFLLRQLMLFVLAEVDLADPFREDLFQTWAELVTLGEGVLGLVGKETKGKG